MSGRINPREYSITDGLGNWAKKKDATVREVAYGWEIEPEGKFWEWMITIRESPGQGGYTPWVVVLVRIDGEVRVKTGYSRTETKEYQDILDAINELYSLNHWESEEYMVKKS